MDFRKKLSILTLSAIAFAGAASAQQQPCAGATNATGPPNILRLESTTDLVTDLTFTCTGPSPVASGSVVTFLNGTVTSRQVSPSLNEATLLVIQNGVTTSYAGVVIGNQIAFGGTAGVTFPSGAYTLKFSNIRVNASQFGPNAFIMETFFIESPDGVAAFAGNNTSVGFIQQGFATPTGGSGASSNNTTSFTLNLAEQFGGAFKTRISTINTATGLTQLCGGAACNAENGEQGSYIPGVSSAVGTASSGTRFLVSFANIQSGVTVYLPTMVTSGSLTMTLTATEAGAYSPVPAGVPAGSGLPANYAGFAAANGAATAVYEVTSTDDTVPNETVSIPGILYFTPNFTPAPGAAAPFVTVTPAPTNTANVPNFALTFTGLIPINFLASRSRQSMSLDLTCVSTSGSVPFTVTYATAVGNWLSGQASGVATPSGTSIMVTANSGSLPLAGSPYMGTITISDPSVTCQPSVSIPSSPSSSLTLPGTPGGQTTELRRRDGTGGGTLPVTLTLIGTSLVVSPETVSVSVPAGQKSTLQMQPVTVTPVGFTATLVPKDGFLLLSPASGSLTLPAMFGVGIDATSLPPGSYSSSVAVQCSTCFDMMVAVNATVTGTAAPAITSITPPSAAAGSPSLTITVTGSGFVGGAGVQWNGLALSTTFVSATTLTAQIPAGDLLNPGTGQIAVANPTGPVSNSVAFLVSSTSALQFLTAAPCRVLDTRLPPTSVYAANSTFGSPYIAAGTVRTIPIPASTNCLVPSNAAAWSLNFTIQPRTTSEGSLTVWPAGTAQPNVSTVSFSNPAVVLAAAGIVPAGAGGAINAAATQDVDLIVDINGYFVSPGAGTLQFYALPPMRCLDTRTLEQSGSFPDNSTFGSPSLDGVHARSFPIPQSTCGAPASASAYSFNVGVVPQGPLYFLAAYPTGGTLPVVSTMNSFDGTILANAAIVPAAPGGAVNFFASNVTDFFVDINGYFAPPGPGGLNFYTVHPCRLVDTRNSNGTLGGPTMAAGTTRTFPLPQGPCGLPGGTAVQAYSLSITAYPTGPALSYITTWPTGGVQPFVSTLNAFKGLPIANAAIVPAGSGGAINVFATDPTNLTIDIAGYFGP